MLFSIKSENLKLASRSRDYMRKSTIENLKTYQPREQNMQLSFDKRCSFPAPNSAFSLGQTRLMSGKLSRLKSKNTRKNRHASGLNENGSNSANSYLMFIAFHLLCCHHKFLCNWFESSDLKTLRWVPVMEVSVNIQVTKIFTVNQ